jgi:hypothetical protein
MLRRREEWPDITRNAGEYKDPFPALPLACSWGISIALKKYVDERFV